jgi:hypothetical protein
MFSPQPTDRQTDLDDSLEHVSGARVPGDSPQLHQTWAEPPSQSLTDVLAQSPERGRKGGILLDHPHEISAQLDQETDT